MLLGQDWAGVVVAVGGTECFSCGPYVVFVAEQLSVAMQLLEETYHKSRNFIK